MKRMPYPEWKEQVLDGIVCELGVSRSIIEETGLPELHAQGLGVDETVKGIVDEVMNQAGRDYSQDCWE